MEGHAGLGEGWKGGGGVSGKSFKVQHPNITEPALEH